MRCAHLMQRRTAAMHRPSVVLPVRPESTVPTIVPAPPPHVASGAAASLTAAPATRATPQPATASWCGYDVGSGRHWPDSRPATAARRTRWTWRRRWPARSSRDTPAETAQVAATPILLGTPVSDAPLSATSLGRHAAAGNIDSRDPVAQGGIRRGDRTDGTMPVRAHRVRSPPIGPPTDCERPWHVERIAELPVHRDDEPTRRSGSGQRPGDRVRIR